MPTLFLLKAVVSQNGKVAFFQLLYSRVHLMQQLGNKKRVSNTFSLTKLKSCFYFRIPENSAFISVAIWDSNCVQCIHRMLFFFKQNSRYVFTKLHDDDLMSDMGMVFSLLVHCS